MERIRKIDIHAHATPFPEYAPKIKMFRDEHWIAPKALIGFYDELDIEKGVLLPLTAAEWQFEQITSGGCKHVADMYPDRFLWFCGVDPRAGGYNENADLSEILLFYKSIGARGMGELTANLYADDPLMDNLFKHCAACNMPVTIHIAPQFGNCYGIVDELGLYRLESMLKKHPTLKILGHSQPFWAEIGKNVDNDNRNGVPKGKVEEGRIVELMRKYPNLYCDCSAGSGANALTRDPDFTERFFAEFSDRVLYGCDICHPFNQHQYMFNDFLKKFREDKRISEENYYKFVRGNAIKLLGLEDKE